MNLAGSALLPHETDGGGLRRAGQDLSPAGPTATGQVYAGQASCHRGGHCGGLEVSIVCLINLIIDDCIHHKAMTETKITLNGFLVR